MQSAELDVLDLEMPEVDADLRACQAAAGCIEFSVRLSAHMTMSTQHGQCEHASQSLLLVLLM